MKYCKSEHCNGGQVFDLSTSKFEDCPLCREIRLSQIENGVFTGDGKTVGLSEKLGFRRIFTRVIFEPTLVFGEYAYNHMDKAAIQPMIDKLTDLMSVLATGTVPKSSILCYIGSKGDVELLGYLLLASAYKSSLIVHELVTPFRLRNIRTDMQKHSELLNADIVVATFTPSIKEDSYLIEDMVRERAYNGKPTFIILSDGVGLNSLIQRFCAFENYSFHQPLYLGIPYLGANDDDDKKLARINKGIQNGNAKLGVTTPLLTMDDISPKQKQKQVVNSIPSVSSRDIFGR